MSATAASASRAAANRANSVMSLRRSGSLMDFSGGERRFFNAGRVLLLNHRFLPVYLKLNVHCYFH